MSEQEKIGTFFIAKKFIQEAREKGLKVVYVSGTFDGLSIHDIRFLNKEKKAGTLLVVGVESNKTVRFNKTGDYPNNDAHDRVEILAALSCVDYVFAFTDVVDYLRDDQQFIQRIQELQPHIVGVREGEINAQAKIQQIEKAGIQPHIINTK